MACLYKKDIHKLEVISEDPSEKDSHQCGFV